MLNVSERWWGALFGSLIGDALALGPHWIYEQEEIAQRFGVLSDYAAPATAYHPGKKAGDQTHYGDQALLLLEAIQAQQGHFNPLAFAQRWANFWSQSKSYRDHATRMTLDRMEENPALLEAGSDSLELGGAARLAPLLVAGHAWPEDELIRCVRQQTALTHPAEIVQDAAELIARTVLKIVAGAEVPVALQEAMQARTYVLPVHDYLRKAETCRDLETRVALAEIGLSCAQEKALPAVFYLLLKHGNDLETALRQNALAGGDSAARGLVLGVILGARHGYAAIPVRWTEGLTAKPALEKFLISLGLILS